MAKKKTKARKVDSQPEPLPALNTCGGQMEPKAYVPEDSCAIKLTRKAERELQTISNQRDRISFLEKELIDAKETLNVALLNHSQTQHALEKELDVPNLAH